MTSTESSTQHSGQQTLDDRQKRQPAAVLTIGGSQGTAKMRNMFRHILSSIKIESCKLKELTGLKGRLHLRLSVVPYFKNVHILKLV